MFNKYNKLLSLILFMSLDILVVENGYAKSAEDFGREIIQEVSDRDNGFGDMSSEVTMVLKDSDGNARARSLKVRSLEVKNNGEKRLFSFNFPKDIKGTTILNYGHIIEEDDQWIYLPAFKRVKRISSSNKSGAFVSSEFSYEDLTSMEVDKYLHRYLGDAEIQSLDCFKVELTPAYKNSGYSQLVAFIDKQDYLIRKIDFYDLNNKFLKTLMLNSYERYKNSYWRPHLTIMTNHQTGNITEMKWTDIHLQTGLSSSDFDRNALKRYR